MAFEPGQMAWKHEVEAYVTAWVAIGRCVVDDITGELAVGWPDVLSWCTGWAWADINARLMPSGVTERMGPGLPGSAVGLDGRCRPERLTDAGQALHLMACLVMAQRSPQSPGVGYGNRNAARFTVTGCSSCGGTFGPGDSGFSHCDEHAGLEPGP